MGFLLKIAFVVGINGVLFWAFDTKLFVDTFSITGGISGYAFIAFLFMLFNGFIKPVLNILAFPFRLLTLGLFSFVINGFLLYLLEHSVNFLELFETSLQISDLSTYIFAGFILASINAALNFFFR